MSKSSGALAPSICLDLRNQCLLLDAQEVPLRPKTFGVLRCLVEHLNQLVTKEQLLAVVWPGCHVSDVVLAVSIRELRKIFDDDPRAPRFIRTVHRRGYRFIGEIVLLTDVGPSELFPLFQSN